MDKCLGRGGVGVELGRLSLAEGDIVIASGAWYLEGNCPPNTKAI